MFLPFLSNNLIKQPALLLAISFIITGCATQSNLSPSFPQNLDIANSNLKVNKAPDKPAQEPLTVEAETPIKAACNKPYKVKGKTYIPMKSAKGYVEHGVASWYGTKSSKLNHSTASGTRFNPKAFSAAHKTLPIPSKVRVTNLRNGKTLDVVINDRGPFRDNNLIDLTQGAAQELGMQGSTEVKIEYLGS